MEKDSEFFQKFQHFDEFEEPSTPLKVKIKNNIFILLNGFLITCSVLVSVIIVEEIPETVLIGNGKNSQEFNRYIYVFLLWGLPIWFIMILCFALSIYSKKFFNISEEDLIEADNTKHGVFCSFVTDIFPPILSWILFGLQWWNWGKALNQEEKQTIELDIGFYVWCIIGLIFLFVGFFCKYYQSKNQEKDDKSFSIQ